MTDADLLELHRIGSAGLLPDVTLLLEVPDGEVQARLVRRDGGDADAIGGRDAHYHARVADAFRRFTGEEPGRFARIDASDSPEATHEAVMRALTPLLERAA